MPTEKFHWTSASGSKVTLPRLSQVKAGVIRRHRKSDPVDFIFSILEDVSDEKTLAAVDDLTTDEINDLFDKWQEDGGGVGESSGSST